MGMPFYSLPATSFDSGEWLEATVSDDGTPLGDAFPVGSTVYIRQPDGKTFNVPDRAGNPQPQFEYWMLLPGPRPVRRFLTGDQVVNFTEGNYPPAPNQGELTALWTSLDPPHAGFLEEGVPRYSRYKKVVIADTTPIVTEKDWEADWDRGVIYLERRNLHPPIPLSPEERQQDIDDCLAHESSEHDESYDGEDGACARYPNASPADLDRVAEELQGLMHARTIAKVEGFSGPGAEAMYWLAFKQLMVKKGFAADVAKWSKITI